MPVYVLWNLGCHLIFRFYILENSDADLWHCSTWVWSCNSNSQQLCDLSKFNRQQSWCYIWSSLLISTSMKSPRLPCSTNTASIRSFLSMTEAEILTHAAVSSRLDYCNIFMSGLLCTTTKNIQMVQNALLRPLNLSWKLVFLLLNLSISSFFILQASYLLPLYFQKVGLSLN